MFSGAFSGKQALLGLSLLGDKVGERIAEKIREVLDSISDGLTEEERVSFYRSLSIISSSLDAVANKALK